ncbi:DUF4054 domain-containing protein [Allopontixanthobacter sediminis]|uniref:DUF4054 domain-containing protein n=1 Tax=Allopontixanthobacter sediminis TaxID=1689985 RepID=A0A845AZX5_9SPHN|nr:DUF4054 domain-containing protein [Allopontixanthobacter sediminis]MXP42982.1 DUF4054 domain-containing protein [Allopontixanthobacter sediminis]
MLTLYLATGVIADGGTVPVSDLLTQFRARYPKFADVPDATVQIWLDEGSAETVTWAETDRASMLYAAHQLSGQGFGAGAIPAGITSFKSGTFSASVSDNIAGKTGFNATSYGREYLALMRRSFAGPRLAWNPPVYPC